MEPDEALREAVEQFESQGKVKVCCGVFNGYHFKRKATFSCFSWWLSM